MEAKEKLKSGTDLYQYLDKEKLWGNIQEFSRFGRDKAGGISRVAFSNADIEARNAFIRMVETELGLPVRMDALGNMFARLEGRDPRLPVIMAGSHLESVRNGGMFDGPAGVFAAYEAVSAIRKMEHVTRHPIELVVMTAEEPTDFGISTIGSRGVSGKLVPAKLKNLKNDEGKTFPEALQAIGGNFDAIETAAVSKGKIACFVELHIEQMPYLYRENKDIGVVTGVTGIYREKITIKGKASHSGTTPMPERIDALCAASELILFIEGAAKKHDGKAVATVGRLHLFPNSANITPETVCMEMEIRSWERLRMETILENMESCISSQQQNRKVSVTREITYDSKPVIFSDIVVNTIRKAAQSLSLSTIEEVSMAGHDAAHMNQVAPSGMIFIPCREGLSHCPSEWTEPENLLNGTACLLQTLLSLDESLNP